MSYNLPDPYVPIARRLADADISASTMGRSAQLDTHWLTYAGKLSNKAQRTYAPSLEAVSDYLNKRSLYLFWETSRLNRDPQFRDGLKDTLPTVLRRAGMEVGSIAGDVDRRVQSVVASLGENKNADIPVAVAQEKQAQVWYEWCNDAVVGVANKLNALSELTPVLEDTALYVAGDVDFLRQWNVYVNGISVPEGQSVIIKPIVCGAETGVWMKDSAPILFEMDLRLDDISAEDAGTYSAVYGSQNGPGVQTQEFVINVT